MLKYFRYTLLITVVLGLTACTPKDDQYEQESVIDYEEEYYEEEDALAFRYLEDISTMRISQTQTYSDVVLKLTVLYEAPSTFELLSESSATGRTRTVYVGGQKKTYWYEYEEWYDDGEADPLEDIGLLTTANPDSYLDFARVDSGVACGSHICDVHQWASTNWKAYIEPSTNRVYKVVESQDDYSKAETIVEYNVPVNIQLPK